MNEQFERQAALLIEILPFVAESNVFALKGGTAINFFYYDCPRISVDIDLHYLPRKNWMEARKDINLHLEGIIERISSTLEQTSVNLIGKEDKDRKILIGKQGSNVKVEPNYRIREVFSEPVKLELCPHLQDRFNRRVLMTCVSKDELFAGKLCATLDRQHPRDLFDIWLYLKDNDWFSSQTIDAFLVYLICRGGQIHETLNPNIKNMR